MDKAGAPELPNHKENLDQLISVTLSKRQWTVIYNIITNVKYGLGDAALVLGIVGVIEPHIAFLKPPTPPQKPEDGVVITKKVN
jgi:hypothetical protein